MEEDIRILEEFINNCNEDLNAEISIKCDGLTRNSIENLIKAYKQKDKDNNDLRRLYRRTAEKLRENGKEELAHYFLAQINEVPTFTIDDDIDYYTEYYKLREENKELKKDNKRYEKELHDVIEFSIPVHLVEEKIEELDKMIEKINKGELQKYTVSEILSFKRIYEELLEKRK